MYGVTEIKSDSGIIKLFKDSEVVFTRNIKQYSIAQNWEILFKKMRKFFLRNKSNIKLFNLVFIRLQIHLYQKRTLIKKNHYIH